jgi:hypothetical protein
MSNPFDLGFSLGWIVGILFGAMGGLSLGYWIWA